MTKIRVCFETSTVGLLVGALTFGSLVPQALANPVCDAVETQKAAQSREFLDQTALATSTH